MLQQTTVNNDDNRLKQRKAALLTKLQEAARSMESRQDLIIESTADPLDHLQEMNQRDLTIETLNRNSRVCWAVRAALKNIENGEYGLCRECGNHIPDRRLDAIPWAEYCIPCQESIENSSDDAQPDWAAAA
jgi:DnaK suppressor protein